MTKFRQLALLFIVSLFAVNGSCAATDWFSAGINVAVTTAPASAQFLHMAPGDSGGTLFTWVHADESPSRVYVNSLASNGSQNWALGAVTITKDIVLSQTSPKVVADGSGGAIVVFALNEATLNGDIYAQRISATGQLMWGDNGIPVCIASGSQAIPRITGDGQGGAYVTWCEMRPSGQTLQNHPYKISAQHLDQSGTPQWAANGISISGEGWDKILSHQIHPAGQEGFLASWLGSSIYSTANVQKITPAGVLSWGDSGTTLGIHSGALNSGSITPDGTGGAVCTWTESRAGINEIYAQRLSNNGTELWGHNGLRMTTGQPEQGAPQISWNGSEAIVTWEQGGVTDIVAQKVSADGTTRWSDSGRVICNAAGYQSRPKVFTSVNGNTYVAWIDYRTGGYQRKKGRVYAQLLDANGIGQWASNGQILHDLGDVSEIDMVVIGPDAAAVGWVEMGSGGDVYAHAFGHLSPESAVKDWHLFDDPSSY